MIVCMCLCFSTSILKYMIWHTYAYIELFALNTVHVLYFKYLREMAFHTKKQKKKILIPNKFYVSFNLALLKKELMLKSTIHVG